MEVERQVKEIQIIDECANILRNASLNCKVNKIDMENVTKSCLEKGEIDEIPWQLIRFHQKSIRGLRSKKKTVKLERLVNSASFDYIYMVHGGRVKPAKQLMLGM